MGWVRFSIVRAVVFSFLFVSSAAVLGLISWQAAQFMNNRYDKPYIIFGLVVAIISILACLAMASQYSFRTHIVLIAFLAIIWLAFASYTTDRIGYVQCEALEGTRRPSKGGSIDNVAWCRMMKAIMAFSWFNFAGLLIAIVSWIRLQEYEENQGYGEEGERYREYNRAVQSANYDNGIRTGPGGTYVVGGTGGTIAPGQPMVAPGTGGQVVYQQPGHNVVVENGQIRQVPVGAPLY